VCFFGDVIVENVGGDLVGLARKTTGIRRGATYSHAALQEARENLRTLNLFQQTRLAIVDAAPDTVNVIADLVERRPTNIEASLRYWTDEQVQGAARWTHRNLFKGGRGATAGVSASPFLQRADGSTWWPALAGPNTALTATLRAERESEASYDTGSAGIILGLRYNRSFKTSTMAGVDVAYVEVTDHAAGVPIAAQDGLLTALQFEANRRDTDDPITPTRGTSTGVRFEWAPEALGSDNSYIGGLAGAAVYVPLLPRTQIGLRLQVGGATPTGNSIDLLPNKRFYSGGAVSHRGFHRRKLGPLDAAGAPVGGEAKLESSLELRFPLFWKFRATAFVDAGQVWPTVGDVRADHIEVAVGPGLWLQTPIGPIRADVGFRITDFEPSQPSWVFHFSVGPAF
jgi:outer membrane protein assembly factor BamA